MSSAQGRPLKPLAADADPFVAAVAEALRDLRLRADLSLRQLAVRCNYSPATLSMAASGKSLPRLEVVEAYVKGCLAGQADHDVELARLRALWDKARAAQDAQGQEVEEQPGAGTRAGSDGAASGHPGSRRGRRPRRTTAMPFADAVAAPGSRPGPAPGPASVVSPVRREAPPKATVRLRDPGDSVTELVQQARMMSSNPAHTALDLCSTPKHFIELLARLRERSGLSLRELSVRCRANGYPVSKSTLHDLLNGTELPSTDLLHAYLHACGCEPGEWMAWHQTRTRLKIAQLIGRQETHVISLLRRDRFTRTAMLNIAVFVMMIAQVATLTLIR